MRDRIADIISSGAKWRDKGEYVLADAIIAALPEMIAPLAWKGDANYLTSSKYIITIYEGMDLPYKLSYGFGAYYFPYLREAKAAANTHRRAAIMAAFKEVKP